MFFDMGIGELLVIAFVGLLIFGPDRLPKVAMQAAQIIRQLRQQADDAKSTIMEAADLDESTLQELRNLDPRRALRDLAAPVEDATKALRDATRPDASGDVKGGSSPSADAVNPDDIV